MSKIKNFYKHQIVSPLEPGGNCVLLGTGQRSKQEVNSVAFNAKSFNLSTVSWLNLDICLPCWKQYGALCLRNILSCQVKHSCEIVGERPEYSLITHADKSNLMTIPLQVVSLTLEPKIKNMYNLNLYTYTFDCMLNVNPTTNLATVKQA